MFRQNPSATQFDTTERNWRVSLRPAERIYQSLDTRYREILRTKNRIQEWEDELQEKCVIKSRERELRQYETEKCRYPFQTS